MFLPMKPILPTARLHSRYTSVFMDFGADCMVWCALLLSCLVFFGLVLCCCYCLLSFKIKCAKPSPNFICAVLYCDCCLSLYMLSCVVFSCVMLSFFWCFGLSTSPPPHVSHKRRSYAHWNLWTKRGTCILLKNILLTNKHKT
jgi:hypothetical protein